MKTLSVIVSVLGQLALGCATFGKPDMGDCPDYLDCAASTGEPTATLTVTYGDGGTCWDEEDARLCRAECSDALVMLEDEGYCADLGAQGTGTDNSTWGIDYSCRDSITSTGDQEGQVAADFSTTDQNGDPLRLYDFCAREVVLVNDAMWNSMLQPEDLEATFEQYHDQGFILILALLEDTAGQPVTQSEVESWAQTFGVTFPVVADGNAAIFERFSNGSLPTDTILAPGAVVVHREDQNWQQDIESSLP